MYKVVYKATTSKKEYRALPGSALCIFNSNFTFVIENIFRKNPNRYQCHELIVLENGKLKNRLVLRMTMRLSICLALCERN